MQNLKKLHLLVAYKILHYQKGTMEKGISFKKHNKITLEEYTDVDNVGLGTKRRSTSGYCTFLEGNLVAYKNKMKYGGTVKCRI